VAEIALFWLRKRWLWEPAPGPLLALAEVLEPQVFSQALQRAGQSQQLRPNVCLVKAGAIPLTLRTRRQAGQAWPSPGLQRPARAGQRSWSR